MKNKKLINLLMQENPNAEVMVAYDSMCGQYDNFILARNRTNGDIYLACEDAESIDLASNDWLELIPLELCCTDSLIDENKRLQKALPYDWDMLQSCRESLREHMVECKRLLAEVERLRGAIHGAIRYANGRETEWDPRAEECFRILESALDSKEDGQ